MYSLEFALSLANYIYLSILLKASPGQRDAGLFLYLIEEMHSGERSVKYQGSSMSDIPALAGAGRGHCRGDIGRSKELPPPEAWLRAGGRESWARTSHLWFGLRLP